jgi:hypothetical protein
LNILISKLKYFNYKFIYDLVYDELGDVKIKLYC